jgi:hypothetical protein
MGVWWARFAFFGFFLAGLFGVWVCLLDFYWGIDVLLLTGGSLWFSF